MLLRRRLYEEDLCWQADLQTISLDELRRAFGAMFDRAACVVEGAGFALDDSIVQRFIRCRRRGIGGEWRAEAESLTDRERLIAAVLKAGREAGLSVEDAGDIDVVGLQVDAMVERWEA